MFRGLDDGFDRFRFFTQFAKIPLLEFAPFPGIMSKPLAQASARRDVFEPLFELQCIFLCTARSEPLDEKTWAIGGSSRGIHAFEFDHFSILSLSRAFRS